MDALLVMRVVSLKVFVMDSLKEREREKPWVKYGRLCTQNLKVIINY